MSWRNYSLLRIYWIEEYLYIRNHISVASISHQHYPGTYFNIIYYKYNLKRRFISKTMQLRLTSLAEHCLEKYEQTHKRRIPMDSLIRTCNCWTNNRTYLHQHHTDTGCSLQDQPEAMDNRNEWQEKVREIRANGMTWWWLKKEGY